MKKILAFETSCDDTAVAIVAENGDILGDAIYSQLQIHHPYGGVVPEIGSRAHIEQIRLVTAEVFHQAGLSPHDIDTVAATCAPGLVGPLLVGAQFAKGFAESRSLPFIAVHHIEGHIFAGSKEPGFPEAPFVALVVSGGHTALYECNEHLATRCLGQTRDDAAGEAFDKIGRALGLSYPAGKLIDDLAKDGDASRFRFPKPMRHDESLDFSFSGLKTFALETLKKSGPLIGQDLSDFCAGLSAVIADSLSLRALRAVKQCGHQALVIGGGVAANSTLRARLDEMCRKDSIALFLPRPRLCTDNAVMIARAAFIKLKQGKTSDLCVDVMAHLPIESSDKLYQRTYSA